MIDSPELVNLHSMVKRISETYEIGQKVEIMLADRFGGEWVGAVITHFDFPGVWVQSNEGGRWFVTNGRHIRPISGVDEASRAQLDDEPY